MRESPTEFNPKTLKWQKLPIAHKKNFWEISKKGVVGREPLLMPVVF